MADKEINVNALPVKAAPSTGDKMLMIGAAEEYQIDYDQLASAILDKLSTKQYSELDTTAKTVLGALDELNGKNIFYGTAINYNDDMNDYTVPGIYYSSESAITQTLKNMPPEYISSGFALLVLPTSVKNGTIVQVIIKGVTADNIYARSQSTSQWYQWRKFSGTLMS